MKLVNALHILDNAQKLDREELMRSIISILIYLIWSLIDKKREERFLREYQNNSK